MNIFWLSVGLFIIGLVEYTIDQYQKLLLSRLKLFSTLAFQLVNKSFECIINLYIFGTIVIFWEKFQQGNHDFRLLSPYIAYTIGTVTGTGLALVVYTRLKKTRDRDRAIKSLEKARNKKKNMDKLKPDISTEVETLFDDVETEDMRQEIKERAIEKASDIVAKQVEKAFTREDKDVGEEDNRDSSQVQSEGPKEEIPPSGPAQST